MKKLDTSNLNEQSTKFSHMENSKKIDEKDKLIQQILKLNRQRVFYEQSQEFQKAQQNQKKLQDIAQKLQEHLSLKLKESYQMQITNTENQQKKDKKSVLRRWKKIIEEFDKQTQVYLYSLQQKQKETILDKKLQIIEDKQTNLCTSQILNLEHKLQKSIKVQNYEKADQFKQDIEILKTFKVKKEAEKLKNAINKKTNNMEKSQQKLVSKEQLKISGQRDELILKKKKELKELKKSYDIIYKKYNKLYKKQQIEIEKYFKNFNPSSKHINLDFEEFQPF